MTAEPHADSLPRLRPWAVVLALPGDRVQIGAATDARHRVGGPDADAVSRTAKALRQGRGPCADEPWFARGLHLLAVAGALEVPDPTPAPACPRVVLQSPTPATDAAASWIASTLAVAGWQAPLVRRLPDTNCVVVRVGQPRWPWIQAVMSRGLPHVVISPRWDSMRVGPTVIPGLTPCLRCLHLARTDRDCDWPWVCHRLEQRPLAEPPRHLWHEAGFVASRLLSALPSVLAPPSQESTARGEGDEPAASDFWVLHAEQIQRQQRAVARHPLCGCWWPEAA